MLTIDEAGLQLIEGFEGLRLIAYQDIGGVWTIGYGTTSGAGIVDVHQGMTCTQAQAQAWLKDYIERGVLPAIEAACGTKVRLNQHQINALCSLGYNYGSGIFGTGWQIGRDLRAGDLSAVSRDFLSMDYVNNQPNAALEARRERERAVFDTPEPTPPSYHYDRFDNRRIKLPHGSNSERLVVENYDKQRPYEQKNHASLLEIEANLKFLAQRIRDNEKADRDPEGKRYWRAWRLTQIDARAAGEVVKPS